MINKINIASEKKAPAGPLQPRGIQECAFSPSRENREHLELLLPARPGHWSWRLCHAGILSPRPLQGLQDVLWWPSPAEDLETDGPKAFVGINSGTGRDADVAEGQDMEISARIHLCH